MNGNNRDNGGYGRFNFGGRKYEAHRIAYEIGHGPKVILANPDFIIGHLCANFVKGLKEDNKLCQNPNHLDCMSGSIDKKRAAKMRGKQKKRRYTASEVLWLLERVYVDKIDYQDATDLHNKKFSVPMQTRVVWSIVSGDSHTVVVDGFLKQIGLDFEKARTIRKEAKDRRQARSRKRR